MAQDEKQNKIEQPNGEEVFQKIHDNYNYLNEMMVNELELSSTHPGITGDNREQIWLKLFRSIIPKKFSLAQGVMIIDSYGNVSREVDIAVFDEQYTPYVFQYNTLKFIPIEAVAVVIECKSKNPDEGKLKEWAGQLKNLKAKPCGIARMATGYTCGLTNITQVQTRPIRILATIKEFRKEDKVKEYANELKEYFDIFIQENSKQFELSIPNEEKFLGWWGNELNGTQENNKDEKEKNNQNEGNSQAEGDNQKEEQKDKIKIIEKSKGKFGKWFECNCSNKICNNNNEECFKKYETKHICNQEPNKQAEAECSKCSNKNSSEQCSEEFYLFERTLSGLKIEGNAFLSLNLQLNQLLMLINNPMLFPHYAYANCFNRIIKSSKDISTKVEGEKI